ncbi:PAS domain-containing protein, partial [Helicobacter sp. NHP22-001]|uniref:PAS domain-containing protein n=1 Tax=Helicobacter sp. NHP22-001 TaxID=3040202 RepID=UPI002555C4E0
MLFASSASKKTKNTELTEQITTLTKENRELRAIYNAISRSLALIEFDTEGKVITANDNFLHLMGYTLEEIKGKHHSMFCDPEFVKTPQYTEFWRHLKSGEFKRGTFKRVTKTGKAVYLEASYNPVFDSEGKIYKFIKFALDI